MNCNDISEHSTHAHTVIRCLVCVYCICVPFWFLQRAAKGRFASAVYATANPSVSLFMHHTPVLCENEGTQKDAVFTIG